MAFLRFSHTRPVGLSLSQPVTERTWLGPVWARPTPRDGQLAGDLADPARAETPEEGCPLSDEDWRALSLAPIHVLQQSV